MRALVLEQGTLSLRDVPFAPRDNECAVRVLRAGICGTDLQLLDGYAGFRGIPGHEFVGSVESAPAADSQWIGRRVVGEINVGCGACDECRARNKEHCPARTVLGIHERSGAFAEWLSLPAGNLHAVPDSVSDETAVFVEPVAACCRILEQIDLDHSMQVAVLGDGRMGLLVAQVLKTRTPQVTMYGRHEAKIKVARALGIDAGLDRQAEQRFDVVVDVTGRGSGLPRALELVRPRGIVVMKTTMHGAAPFESWPAVVNEVTLMGSRCGPFQPAIEMLASGAVRTGPLISDVKPLTDYSRAFEAARGSLKVLLDPAAG